MAEQPVQARLDGTGHQIAEITVHAGYHPAAIVARAGLPLRLVFRRDDDDACTERVVFSAPRLDRRLVQNGTTTIDLPAQPPGDIRFTCGMGRYRGHIVLVREQGPTIVARLRQERSRFESPPGAALTSKAHDPGAKADRPPSEPAVRPVARPRWLLPGIVVAMIAGLLVLAGIVSLSMVLYAGMFGGMLLMHVGGHGGHGGRDQVTPGDANLKTLSSGTQLGRSDSDVGPADGPRRKHAQP